MKILIMGATGNAGSHAIQSLIAKGVRPTAAVRNIEKAKEKFGNSVDYVYFDYLDASTYDAALEGVDKLFFIAPPPKKDPAIVRELMKAIKKAGVSFVLFQSGRTSGGYKGKPLYEIENDLRNSDQNICIIRPAWYMQNFHTWTGTTLEDNELCLPTEDAKVSVVDLNDLGAAIAAILTTDGHAGKEYSITGGEALSHGRIADILSGAMGKSIVFSNPTEETYVQRMIQKGWTEYAANHSKWLFMRIREGSEAVVSSDFQNLVGRKPISFAEFAKTEFGA
ncbi:MAG: SDR family oxidoreductase [Chitinophagales bacterium]